MELKIDLGTSFACRILHRVLEINLAEFQLPVLTFICAVLAFLDGPDCPLSRLPS